MKKIISSAALSLMALAGITAISPVFAHAATAVSIAPVSHTITVLSPNGGESFNPASPITVKWAMNYNSSSVTVRLFGPVSSYYYVSPVMTGTSGNQNQFTIPMPLINANPTASALYKVQVCDNNQSVFGIPGPLCDFSDGNFVIGSTQVVNPIPATIATINTAKMSCSINVLSPLKNDVFLFTGSPSGSVAPYSYSFVYTTVGNTSMNAKVSVPGIYGLGTLFNINTAGTYLLVSSLGNQSSKVFCQ